MHGRTLSIASAAGCIAILIALALPSSSHGQTPIIDRVAGNGSGTFGGDGGAATAATVHVVATPHIALSSDTLNLGIVLVGQTVSQSVMVGNTGELLLNVSSLSIAGPDSSQFSAAPSSFTVAPGDSEQVTVTYTPTQVGWARASLIFMHDSSDTVALSGIGRITPPTGDLARTKIAFMSNRDGNTEIYVINADGSNLRRLTDNDSGDDHNPVWSPDGTQLAFQSYRDGNFDLYVINTDGSNLRRLTDHPEDDRNPVWSPNGTQLAFESSDEIYVINADGSGLRNLSNHFSRDYFPVWSPNESKIAFISDRDGGNSEIYIVNADGSGLRNLSNHSADDTFNNITRYPRHDYFSVWSPDGSQLAFRSGRDGGEDIYVINTDGSNLRRLTNGGNNRNPVWSPDGGQLAFESVGGAVFVVNADGSNRRSLGIIPHNSSLIWLPDGSRLAFESSGEVFVVNADGSNRRNLSNQPGSYDAFPVWSPDGTQLAFVFGALSGSFQNLFSGDLYIVNADGSDLHPITSQSSVYIHIFGQNVMRPTWSPFLPEVSDPLILALGTAFGQPSETVSLPVVLDNPTVSSVGGLQFAVVGDTARARFISLNDSVATLGFDALTSMHGDTVRAVVFSENNDAIPPGTRTLASLTYRIEPSTPLGSLIPLTLIVQRVGDPQAAALETTALHGAIQVGIRGDVNLDSLLDVLDLIRIARLLVGRDPMPAIGSAAFAIADFNRDGALTVQDIVVQANALFGLP